MILREFDDSDLKSVNEYASDPAVAEYMEWGPSSEKETRSFLRLARDFRLEKPRLQFELAIYHTGERKVIGGCGLTVVDKERRQAALGYVLNRKFWRKGYVSEAAAAMLRFGFAELNLHRIFATCDELNEGSYAVMRKIGMRQEAHFIEERFIKGRWRNTFVYALLAREWREQQKKEGEAQGGENDGVG